MKEECMMLMREKKHNFPTGEWFKAWIPGEKKLVELAIGERIGSKEALRAKTMAPSWIRIIMLLEGNSTNDFEHGKTTEEIRSLYNRRYALQASYKTMSKWLSRLLKLEFVDYVDSILIRDSDKLKLDKITRRYWLSSKYLEKKISFYRETRKITRSSA